MVPIELGMDHGSCATEEVWILGESCIPIELGMDHGSCMTKVVWILGESFVPIELGMSCVTRIYFLFGLDGTRIHK